MDDASTPAVLRALRVTLHVGNLLIRIDSQPSLAIEVTTP